MEDAISSDTSGDFRRVLVALLNVSSFAYVKVGNSN